MMMTAVDGFNDRAMINQCLLNCYVISYEPYNFKGRLSDFPLTVAYGNKMDKLRTDLREYFWDGTFTEKQGGTVSLENGETLDSYAVYEGTNGKQGMIIVNYSDRPVTVIPQLFAVAFVGICLRGFLSPSPSAFRCFRQIRYFLFPGELTCFPDRFGRFSRIPVPLRTRVRLFNPIFQIFQIKSFPLPLRHLRHLP